MELEVVRVGCTNERGNRYLINATRSSACGYKGILQRTSIMFFRKPQILHLAERTLTLISRYQKMEIRYRDEKTPLLLNILNAIPDRPGNVIANLDPLQEAYSATWTSAPASHKTGNICKGKHPFTVAEMITASVLDPEQIPV